MTESGDNVLEDGWIKVDDGGIDTILRMLSQSFPESIYIYNFIKVSLHWSKAHPNVISSIFSNSQSQGSVIATVKGSEYAVAVFIPNADKINLGHSLQGNHIINWNGPIIFFGLQLSLSQSIKDTIAILERKVIENNIYDSYWISSVTAQALEVKCPDDMYFSKLEPKHAALVNSKWPYTSSTSLSLIIDMINVNETVGLFTKKDSTLVSWVLKTFYGLGMLFTLDGYRKKGYGTLVLKKLVKLLVKQGINPNAFTLRDNVSAKSVFLTIGFEFVCSVEAIKSV